MATKPIVADRFDARRSGGYPPPHNYKVMQVDTKASDILFQALGDPTRRALFETLNRDGEQNVRTLTAKAGVSQPMVSRHLTALRLAGLVTERRAGREHHFSARPEGLVPMADWMTRHGGFWNVRITALQEFVERAEQADDEPADHTFAE